jgi:hypothetical protein
MLFEMCHPVFGTGMERAVVLRNLEKADLPPHWPVRESHPRVCDLLLSMIAPDSRQRPSAEQVCGSLLAGVGVGNALLAFCVCVFVLPLRGVAGRQRNAPTRPAHAAPPGSPPRPDAYAYAQCRLPFWCPSPVGTLAPPLRQVIRTVTSFQATGPVVLNLDRDELGGDRRSGTLLLSVEVDLSKGQSSTGAHGEGSAGTAASSGHSVDPSTEALTAVRACIFEAAPAVRIEQSGVSEDSSAARATMEFLLAKLDFHSEAAVSRAVAALPFVSRSSLSHPERRAAK